MTILNPALLESQGITAEGKQRLEALHKRMNDLVMRPWPKDGDEKADAQLAADIEALEYEMQVEWGFKRRADMHTHWRRAPGCSCPSFVNHALFTNGAFARVVNPTCRYHGTGRHRPDGVIHIDQEYSADRKPTASASAD